MRGRGPRGRAGTYSTIWATPKHGVKQGICEVRSFAGTTAAIAFENNALAATPGRTGIEGHRTPFTRSSSPAKPTTPAYVGQVSRRSAAPSPPGSVVRGSNRARSISPTRIGSPADSIRTAGAPPSKVTSIETADSRNLSTNFVWQTGGTAVPPGAAGRSPGWIEPRFPVRRVLSAPVLTHLE